MVSKDKYTVVYEEIYVVGGATNSIRIIKKERVINGSKLVINSGRIIVVHHGMSLGDYHVLPAE